VAVGGLIMLTNLRPILSNFELSGSARIPAYLGVLAVTALALYISMLRSKQQAVTPSSDPVLESVNA